MRRCPSTRLLNLFICLLRFALALTVPVIGMQTLIAYFLGLEPWNKTYLQNGICRRLEDYTVDIRLAFALL